MFHLPFRLWLVGVGDGVFSSCIDSKHLSLYIHLLKGRDQVGGLHDWGSAGDDGVVWDDLVLGRVVDGVDPGGVADGLLPHHGGEDGGQVDGDQFSGEGRQDEVASGSEIDPVQPRGVGVLGEERSFIGHPPFAVTLRLKGGH